MDEQSFLDSCAAAPHDLATRLVFADWLEEQGDVRAELVRLLVRLASIDNQQPEYPSLKQCEADLSRRCSTDWLATVRVPLQRLIGTTLHLRMYDASDDACWSEYWVVTQERLATVQVRRVASCEVDEPAFAEDVPDCFDAAQYLVWFIEPMRPVRLLREREKRLGKQIVDGVLCFRKQKHYYEIWNGKANFCCRNVDRLDS